MKCILKSWVISSSFSQLLPFHVQWGRKSYENVFYFLIFELKKKKKSSQKVDQNILSCCIRVLFINFSRLGNLLSFCFLITYSNRWLTVLVIEMFDDKSTSRFKINFDYLFILILMYNWKRTWNFKGVNLWSRTLVVEK